jgi:dTDP-4-amino-4,6-dideoxy-D-glucose acyltransferase
MYLNEEQLKNLGLRSYGENVKISDKASIYGAGNISIGSNVRIDDFCILSAGKEIIIENYVHIACYSSLIGHEVIHMKNFSGLSSRVTILSSSDDYSGKSMTNPTVPSEYLNIYSAPVVLGEHVIIGATSIILPGVDLGWGVAIGAMSLVKYSIPIMATIYAGNPLKYIKRRDIEFKVLEEALRRSHDSIK